MTDAQKVLTFQQELLDYIRSPEGQEFINNNYDKSKMSGAQIYEDLVKKHSVEFNERWSLLSQ
jgi:hypothetical protein